MLPPHHRPSRQNTPQQTLRSFLLRHSAVLVAAPANVVQLGHHRAVRPTVEEGVPSPPLVEHRAPWQGWTVASPARGPLA